MNEQAAKNGFTKKIKTKLTGLWQSSLDFFKNLPSNFVKSLREKNFYYLSFFLPIIVLYICYACVEMFPFGSKTILTLDMDGQYIYFFEQIRDVYTGKESIFYTFQRCLGGDFLGYFTYYLASPISFIVVLFPGSMMTEAVMTIMLVKSGLAGLTFSIYLNKTREKNTVGFIIFPVMYALCSYSTMYQFNTMWMDAFFWLPMIALGIEKMISEGKFKLFTISLALAIYSNYYIGYMLCFFVFIYFIFSLLIRCDKESNLLNERYHILKSFVRVALFSLIALMLASVAILSAYHALSFGKTSYQDNPLNSKIRFEFLHLFAKAFLGSFDTLRPEGTPNIYAGLFLLILLPVFYMAKKVKPKEKVAYTILCLIFVVSFSINSVDIVWHGLQTPVWFNYRYSFMLTFVLLAMAYRGYEEYDDCDVAFIGKTCAFLIFTLIIIQNSIILYRYENPGGGWERVDTEPGYGMVWLSILFLLVYLLIFYIRKTSKYVKTTTVLLAVVVVIELFANSTINWVGVIKDGGWASRNDYIEYVNKWENVTDEVYAKDNSFFRMERTTWRKQNDNMAINLNGTSEFTSTFNANTVKFMQSLGFHTNEPTNMYISGNAAIDSLLGIKYVIGSNVDDTNGYFPGLNDVSNLYNYYLSSNGKYRIYENPFVLSVAFRTDEYIKDFEFDKTVKSPFKHYNSLVGHMLGKDDARVFETCYYVTNEGTLKSTALDENGGKSFYKYDNNSTGKFYFSVVANTDGNIYMYLPTPYTTQATLKVNEKEMTKKLFKDETKRVIDLGYYEKGATVNVELEFSHYRLYFWDTQDYFVQINENTLREVTGKLKADGLKIQSYSDTKLEGIVNSSADGCIFTTIPYDKNWNVYVDGKRVETYMLAESMLGFDITDGTHTVELKYVHKPFIAGCCLGALGLAMFITLSILDKRYRKKLIEQLSKTEVQTENDFFEDENNNDAFTFLENDKIKTKSEDNNDIPS